MLKVLSVAHLNFTQGIKEKIFFGVVFFFVFFLGFDALLGELSPGENEKVLRNAGLVGIELSSLILIVFSLTLSFYKELDSRILEIYLVNFSRTQYLLGKLLGYLLIFFFYLVLSGTLYTLLLLVYHAFLWQSIVGLYPLFLKLSIIIGFCLVFCCLFSSPLIAVLCSFFIYFAGETVYPALKIISQSGNSLQTTLFKFFYFLLPNMERLDIKSLVVWGKLPTASFFLSISFYSLIYILLLFLMARFIFIKKAC